MMHRMSLLKEQHSELQEHCNAKNKRARTLYERLDDCIQKLGTYLSLKIKTKIKLSNHIKRCKYWICK